MTVNFFTSSNLSLALKSLSKDDPVIEPAGVETLYEIKLQHPAV
jgi:hypothetical protein